MKGCVHLRYTGRVKSVWSTSPRASPREHGLTILALCLLDLTYAKINYIAVRTSRERRAKEPQGIKDQVRGFTEKRQLIPPDVCFPRLPSSRRKRVGRIQELQQLWIL